MSDEPTEEFGDRILHALLQPYREQVSEIEKTEQQLRSERAELAATINPERHAARIAVLTRQIEEALAANKLPLAENKKGEVATLEESAKKANLRLQAIDKETAQLVADKRKIAQQVLDENYPAIRVQVQELLETTAASASSALTEYGLQC